MEKILIKILYTCVCIPHCWLPGELWSLAWDHASLVWDAQCMCTFILHFSHHDSGLAFSQIVLIHVFMNRYRQYGFYDSFKLGKNEPRTGISFSFRRTYVQTFKYFLVVTAQWNFLYIFLASIPPNILGFILKFQIFF